MRAIDIRPPHGRGIAVSIGASNFQVRNIKVQLNLLNEVAAEVGWITKNTQMCSEQWISQPDGISSDKWDWGMDGGHTNGKQTWKGGGARTGV